MSILRVGHFSDAHIDHTTHAGTPSLRAIAWQENLRAVVSAVAAAMEAGVDVFIHAGDAFAHGRPSPEALLMFTEALRPLLESGVPVVLIEGNHERLRHRSGQRTASSVLAEMLAAYGEVHVVDNRPELIRTSNGLQVACLPWLDTFPMLLTAAKLDEPEALQHEFIAREAIGLLLCAEQDMGPATRPKGPLLPESRSQSQY